MSRFRFELATEADDADLRDVLARTPMGGRIAVTFRREPSYFKAAVVDGPFRQVVACRDTETGCIIGFGLRAIRELYVNGEPRPIGYLGGLRVLPEYRNIGLVARGYAFFRKLHEDGRTPFYLTTIAEGNTTALAVLTSGRARLPQYHDAGVYHTATFTLLGRSRRSIPPSLTLEPARSEDSDDVTAFLRREGPRRQFFPCDSPTDRLASDILLARLRGRIVGILAAWDQHSYKQTIVESYTGWLRIMRPLLGLPRPGQPLRYHSAAIPVVEEDDLEVFTALIEGQRARLASGPSRHLLLGLHESDPLLRALRPGWGHWYRTRLYLVSWPDGDAARQKIDNRPPYLELGCL
jgi:hypothetical protein